jgi:hypothetical protein
VCVDPELFVLHRVLYHAPSVTHTDYCDDSMVRS